MPNAIEIVGETHASAVNRFRSNPSRRRAQIEREFPRLVELSRCSFRSNHQLSTTWLAPATDRGRLRPRIRSRAKLRAEELVVGEMFYFSLFIFFLFLLSSETSYPSVSSDTIVEKTLLHSRYVREIITSDFHCTERTTND